MKKIQLYFFIVITLFISACNQVDEKQKKAAEGAITALNKLNAATEVGINKLEYSKMLIDAQASVNQAAEALTDGELKQEIKLAMENYIDAKNLWNARENSKILIVCNISDDNASKKEKNIFDDVLKNMCDEQVFALVQKYKIPQTTLPPDAPATSFDISYVKTAKIPVILRDEGLSLIWSSATQHLNRASVLTNENKFGK